MSFDKVMPWAVFGAGATALLLLLLWRYRWSTRFSEEQRGAFGVVGLMVTVLFLFVPTVILLMRGSVLFPAFCYGAMTGWLFFGNVIHQSRK